ncbi:NAD(P)/FAD-dependent oxidoreductase [Halobacterium litoreum]|uniref:NAD(P)/FAD-dependent oxidoreductase n=1 Tax=Halobacterium litoreum TaxID=2039234 RepID=A0ABD5NHX9_9EURY|nr:FAD-dependent oxidoreductase [Halobacterium litoreum]UHH12457.1 FAD-dependent oxidoreductase [Halobacterium litoreum]
MRVAVLGAGYAGVVLADRLERRLPSDVDLVVVDDTGSHLVQHELHRAVRRPSFEDDIVVSLDDIFDRARVRHATVASVDRDRRVVEFADGEEMAYDVAAVCLGAETAYYDLPGVEEHSIPLKRLPDARRIRESFLDTVRAGGGTVVVGGAGLSGVQVAGELAAFAREEHADDDVDVVLVEQMDDVAPSFPAKFQDAVREELDAEGVDVRTGVTVEQATEEAVETESGVIPYETFVWTGGIRGPDALAGERADVRADLTLDDHTVAVGDVARVVDAEGAAVPASAAAAVREAKVAARNVERLVDDQRDVDDGFRPRLERYTFDSPGWLVSVGDGAVAQVGPSVFRGRAAKAVKTGVGASYLAAAGDIRNAVGLVREEFDFERHGD